MTTGVIDATALDRLQRIGGAGLARQMIALFLEQGAARIEAAAAGCGDGDAEGVERAAHALKSSAGNVGAVRLQQAAEDAERAAESGDVEALNALVDALSTEYSAAAAALTGFLAELDR